MKTIDSNALVQLNPDVIPVGHRPSPGVFEYGQGAVGLPSISCAGATSRVILEDMRSFLMDGNIAYRLNTNINGIEKSYQSCDISQFVGWLNDHYGDMIRASWMPNLLHLLIESSSDQNIRVSMTLDTDAQLYCAM